MTQRDSAESSALSKTVNNAHARKGKNTLLMVRFIQDITSNPVGVTMVAVSHRTFFGSVLRVWTRYR